MVSSNFTTSVHSSSTAIASASGGLAGSKRGREMAGLSHPSELRETTVAAIAGHSLSASASGSASGSGSAGSAAVASTKRKYNDQTSLFPRVIQGFILSYLTHRQLDEYDQSFDAKVEFFDRNMIKDLKQFAAEREFPTLQREVEQLLNATLPNREPTTGNLRPKFGNWFRQIFPLTPRISFENSEDTLHITTELVFHGWESKTIHQQLWMLRFFKAFHDRVDFLVAQPTFSHPMSNISSAIYHYMNLQERMGHLWHVAEHPQDLQTRPQTIDTRTLTLLRRFPHSQEDIAFAVPTVATTTSASGSGGAPAARPTGYVTANELEACYKNDFNGDLIAISWQRVTRNDMPLSQLSDIDSYMHIHNKLQNLKDQLYQLDNVFKILGFPILQDKLAIVGDELSRSEVFYSIFNKLIAQTSEQQIWFLRFFFLFVGLNPNKTHVDEWTKKELQSRCAKLRNHFQELMTIAENPSLLVSNPNTLSPVVLEMINTVSRDCLVRDDEQLDALHALPSIDNLTIDFESITKRNIDLHFLSELRILKVNNQRTGNEICGECSGIFINLENCRKLTNIRVADSVPPNLLSLKQHPIPVQIDVDDRGLQDLDDYTFLAQINPNVNIVRHPYSAPAVLKPPVPGRIKNPNKRPF